MFCHRRSKQYLRSMRLPISVVVCLISAVSCNFKNTEPVIVYDTIPAPTESLETFVSQPPMLFAGRLPCADCAGINTELYFYPDSMTFRIRETYINTGEGDKLFESTGTYAVNTGTTQDSGAKVYRLHPGDNEKARAFKVINDSALLMLDRNLDEIQSSLNYYLVRVPDSLLMPQ